MTMKKKRDPFFGFIPRRSFILSIQSECFELSASRREVELDIPSLVSLEYTPLDLIYVVFQIPGFILYERCSQFSITRTPGHI